MGSRSRGAFRPSFAHPSRPEDQEGAGNAGCLLHPRSRVQYAQKKAHTSIQVQSEHSGIPCAVVLRLMPCSPWRRIPLASIAAGLRPSKSRLGFASLRRLDASHGRQDHTVLPSAAMLSSGALCSFTETSALRTSCAPGIAAATASRTYVRDDRDTPLWWDGMAGILLLICPTG